MKNKITILLLCFVMLFVCATPTFAEKAVSEDDAQRLLSVLEIMNGDENGNLNLDTNVTRAEFSKMLVTSSVYKGSLPTNAISTGFSDVSASHWAAPYIRIASQNKWIYGYSDGSFAPQNNIKLEEAATMLLRVLGYTSNDVTGVYPNGQLALYEALDLDVGVSAKKSDTLSRKDCLYLFVNLLNAKTKTGQIYAQTLGYSLGTDGKIDIYKTLSDKTEGPFVLETKIEDIVKNAGKYTVYRKDKKSSLDELEKYDVIYYSDTLQTLWAYDSAVTGIYESSVVSGTLPTSVTVSGKNYTFENTDAAKSMSVYGSFVPDDTVTLLLGREGTIVCVIDASKYYTADKDEYLNMINNTLSDPYVYNGNISDYEFLSTCEKIVLESSQITADKLNKYDILYYSPVVNTVWVYREAITGKYVSATPSVSAPTSVAVGSKNYGIETDEAAYDLSFMGKFEPNDMVTLLLGKDKEIAAVVSIDEYISIDSDNYLELIESTLEGPYVVASTYSSLGLPSIGLSVTRNNKSASIEDIKKYDVVYYSEAAKALMVYGKTASGTYTAATPSADIPTQITVAGKTYKLANSEVAISVSNVGKYPTGSLVTLLLGRNDEVCAVIPMSEYAKDVYGIVIATGAKSYTDENGKTYSAKTVDITATDGTAMSIQSSSNVLVGDIVKVSYSDKVSLSTVKSKSISGAVTANAIGKNELSSDLKILETDINGNNPSPLFFSRLTGATLSEDDVRFYATDAEGKITDLILADFSGDSYKYGIMLTSEDASHFVSEDEDYDYSQMVNYIYEYQIGNEFFTLNSAAGYANNTGPCVLIYSGQSLVSIDMLTKLKDVSRITSFGMISGKELFLYSDSMEVYTPNTNKRVELKYSTMPLSELLENMEDYDVSAYADLSAKYGGRIRLIIAKAK